jgi:AbrB family looped-hinge helix DNA binding protein
MQTKLSTKGQVVLPNGLRRQLGLRAGDSLEANVEGNQIVLTPHRKRSGKAHIVNDPVTGLPVLSIGSNAPALSSKEVAEILTNFP